MTKVFKSAALVVLAGVLVFAANLTVAQDAKQSRTIQIEGSTTVGPIADAYAEVFQNMYPDASITVKKTGSGDGAAALIDGRCDIATMSRFMKPEEFKKAVENGVYPVAHVVSMDALCVIVHPSNPVDTLPLDTVKKIYKGDIKNWKEVGGADMPIVVISRDTSSGTYEYFNEHVMKKEKMADTVEYSNANPQVQNRVKTTPGAIGYVGLAFLDDVKAIECNGVAPSRTTVLSGKYPIARPLFMFTNGYPASGTLVKEFVEFHYSEKGHNVIIEKGFVPLTEY